MVGRTSWRSGIGQEALPEVWEWSAGPPGGLKVVGRFFRMFGSGWKALPKVQE